MSIINILKLKLQIKFPSALPTKINRGHIMFCLNVFSWQSMNSIFFFCYMPCIFAYVLTHQFGFMYEKCFQLIITSGTTFMSVQRLPVVAATANTAAM